MQRIWYIFVKENKNGEVNQFKTKWKKEEKGHREQKEEREKHQKLNLAF